MKGAAKTEERKREDERARIPKVFIVDMELAAVAGIVAVEAVCNSDRPKNLIFALSKDCRYRLAIYYFEGLSVYCGPDGETTVASMLNWLVLDARRTISDDWINERQVRCEDLE